MSKSKGNILDPLDLIDGIELAPLIEKRTTGLMRPELAPRIKESTIQQFPNGIPAYGTDALRFTFCSLATNGRDVRFDLGRVEGYRNFCNKIWNASRFVIMNAGDYEVTKNSAPSLTGRWIQSKLTRAITQVRDSMASYRFDHAAQAIYDFTWNEYCDWYLELAKPILNETDTTDAVKLSTERTLAEVLETLSRLAHPLMPFITEEIRQRVAPLVGKSGSTIMLEPYPIGGVIDKDAEDEVDWLKSFVFGLRQIRGETGIPPSKRLSVLLQGGHTQDRGRVERNRLFIEALGRIDSVKWLKPNAEVPESAIALVGDLKLLVPLAGTVNVEAELSRLSRELGRQTADREKSARKLSSENFLTRAPQNIVAKEKARVSDLESSIAQLKIQVERLKNL